MYSLAIHTHKRKLFDNGDTIYVQMGLLIFPFYEKYEELLSTS